MSGRERGEYDEHTNSASSVGKPDSVSVEQYEDDEATDDESTGEAGKREEAGRGPR